MLSPSNLGAYKYSENRAYRRQTLDHPTPQAVLPSELLLVIAQCLQHPRDLLNLSLASWSTHQSVLTVLYASLECKSYSRSKERLRFLQARHDLAYHIKSAFLRPNDLMSSSFVWIDTEVEVSDAFELLVPHLPSLETFIWDGLEPPEDSLWIALRKHCPRLRYIGSTVGAIPISEHSELCNFNDLAGFSLITNYHERPFSMSLFHHFPFIDPDAVQALPESLWNMLIDRCHNLKELTLGGERTSYYTPLFDVRPLVRGHWPQLRSLILGHTLVQNSGFSLLDWDSISQVDIIKDFSCFISAHSHLRKLHIPYDSRFPPLDLAGSDVTITEFSGTHFDLLSILPRCHLTTLKMCCERLQIWHLIDLIPCLRDLHDLIALELWIDLSHRVKSDFRDLSAESNAAVRETDHIKVFRPLIAACPSLLHLKIMCTTKRKFGFHMRNLWKAIEGGPRLRSLEIQKVGLLVEESMASSALRIARHVPSLQRITLCYAKQPWTGLTRMKVKQSGVYHVVALLGDTKSVRIVADETGEGLFRKYSRHYKRTLDPQTAIGDIADRYFA